MHDFEELQMTQSQPARSIIDTHRYVFGPKLRQKFVANIGFDDAKPLPQANAGEMFLYRESVDVDYSMEIQQKSGVTLCVNSYGRCTILAGSARAGAFFLPSSSSR
jgi:hypothetical protein